MDLQKFIEQKVLEYLNDISVEKRNNYNLVISNDIYNTLDKEQKYKLREMMSIECSGMVVHNDYLSKGYIALVDMTLPTSNKNRVYQITI